MKHFLKLFIPSLILSFTFILTNSDKAIKKSPTMPELSPQFEWAWMQRTYPHYQISEEEVINSLKEVQALRESKKLQKNSNATNWEFAGPTNVGGRIVDLEIDPTNSNIIYAAAATGGVYKTTDKGSTWFSIFDDQPTLSIGDIGIDPNNTDIIYVGSGEGNGGHNNFPGMGMFKSTDAGASWTHIGLEKTASIGRVVVDPNNSQRVFVAATGSYFGPNPERGIYLSTDAGSSWSKSLFVSDSTGGTDIIINPNNSNIIYAAMWERVRRPNSSHLYGPSGGIFKSTDGGVNWVKFDHSNGLPNAATNNIGRIGLAIYKQDPNTLYALYNNGSTLLGLYKTTNAGSNWNNANTNNSLSDAFNTFSWYFGQVRIDPNDVNNIYVLDVSFAKSTNAGVDWPIIYGYGGPPNLHVDHHALAIDPNNSNWLISGNDGGINISTDGGTTWSTRAHLPITQFYEIGLDKLNPLRLYGGTQDNGTYRTKTGNIDDWDHIFYGDGFYVIVDHTNSDIIFAESQGGNLARSVDGGNSFQSALDGIDSNEPTNWSTPVIMDPNDHNILYYGTDRVYRSTNNGLSWNALTGDLTDAIPGTRLGTVTTIAVAPSNSDVIYAGTDDSHVWVSIDNGSTWNDVSSALPTRWVTRVVVDPNDEAIIYATFSGLKWKDPQPHVFKSTDYGVNWTDISSNLPDIPVNAFAVDKVHPERLYLGSDAGAFVSFNSGASWEIMGEGLPLVSIYDMKIHPIENFLVVGTHGRSMYKIDLDNIVSSVDNSSNILNTFKLDQNYPNPFNPETKIKFSLNADGIVKLKVFNITGELVTTLVNKELSQGSHEVSWNINSSSVKNISSGVYFYSLEFNNSVQTKKMILLK